MKIAYIDESGNKDIDLPKPGATSHYVVGCVLVSAADVDKLDEIVSGLLQRGAELKSAAVGKNRCRRLALLQGLTAIPARFHVLAVDKRRLGPDTGYRWRQSLYKNVLRRAADGILTRTEEVKLIIDSQGDEEFQRGVREYLERHYSGPLFAKSHMEFARASESRGVQLADFVSGSVRIRYEDDDQALLDPIRDQLHLVLWPRRQHEEGEVSENVDPKVWEVVDRKVQKFLQDRSRPRDESEEAQVACVLLLWERAKIDPHGYIKSKGLRRYLRQQIPDWDLADQAFRSQVIGRARDAGVPIVSGPAGYKLPVSSADFFAHVDRTSVRILPMVHRLMLIRDDLRAATGEDLLEREGFEYLRTLADGRM